jgi:[acyl-carrier-protein] S-malonyltransferase
MPKRNLIERMPDSVLAFRGYNVTNLGRTPELLEHAAFATAVERQLAAASQAASDILKRPVDLVGQVRERRESTLEGYGEALALVLAVEAAQLELLREHFGIDWSGARFSFGFSLGEIAAVIAGGVVGLNSVLEVLLPLADDCVTLAHESTLGVLFTRSRELSRDDVFRLCLEINQEGRGVMGVSAHLAPNAMLVIGQHETLDRFMVKAKSQFDIHVHLRKNDSKWPPVHTPIVWQRHISNRAAERMHTMPLLANAAKPRVFSLVSGCYGYTSLNTRDLLCRWIDHPQRLWDAVYETLATSVATILHIGPGPNIIPATYKRLSSDVISQTQDSRGLRALSAAVRRQWLLRLLPHRAALLRAPFIEHIILEDWLLANAPS